jgi:hypothetical protein
MDVESESLSRTYMYTTEAGGLRYKCTLYYNLKRISLQRFLRMNILYHTDSESISRYGWLRDSCSDT